MSPRLVTLVLVDAEGTVRGALPPFKVDFPYWPEARDVVAAARDLYGVDVTILRLLRAERPAPPGGAVTYLAEADRIPDDLTPVEVDLTDHPKRAPYARPGGPAADLAWAATHRPFTKAIQQRTWNLSTVWRLETATGPVWFKHVPAFFVHESAVITWLMARGFTAYVPTVLAADGTGRMLMDHIPGEDCYGAGIEVVAPAARQLLAMQIEVAGSVPELLSLGVPDMRGAHLVTAIAETVAQYGDGDPRLEDMVAALPERMAAVEACGVPDTLLHGDPGPNNLRGADGRYVLLDWGDSTIAHPGFDLFALIGGLAQADADRVLTEWADRWRAKVPGCDPLRAVELLRPVGALRAAMVYAGFVANIEPAEHPYHAPDVRIWLNHAIQKPHTSDA